ncbi:unnamed protein product, partial [Ceratitis capitata]
STATPKSPNEQTDFNLMQNKVTVCMTPEAVIDLRITQNTSIRSHGIFLSSNFATF